jgi:hypothetical protein
MQEALQRKGEVKNADMANWKPLNMLSELLKKLVWKD